MARLSAEGLVARAGDARIGPISLQIERGRGLALVGPSGSGKSTVLRALAALCPLEAGAITLDGEGPDALGVPRYRRRVVLLASTPALGDGTVQAALQRPFELASADGADFPKARARQRLAELGLHDHLERPIASLSTGERQRVALIRALLVDPDVLLADEPTSALDPETAARVEGLLRERLTAGMGLLLVSHDPEQRARLTDAAEHLP